MKFFKSNSKLLSPKNDELQNLPQDLYKYTERRIDKNKIEVYLHGYNGSEAPKKGTQYVSGAKRVTVTAVVTEPEGYWWAVITDTTDAIRGLKQALRDQDVEQEDYDENDKSPINLRNMPEAKTGPFGLPPNKRAPPTPKRGRSVDSFYGGMVRETSSSRHIRERSGDTGKCEEDCSAWTQFKTKAKNKFSREDVTARPPKLERVPTEVVSPATVKHQKQAVVVSSYTQEDGKPETEEADRAQPSWIGWLGGVTNFGGTGTGTKDRGSGNTDQSLPGEKRKDSGWGLKKDRDQGPYADQSYAGPGDGNKEGHEPSFFEVFQPFNPATLAAERNNEINKQRQAASEVSGPNDKKGNEWGDPRPPKDVFIPQDGEYSPAGNRNREGGRDNDGYKNRQSAPVSAAPVVHQPQMNLQEQRGRDYDPNYNGPGDKGGYALLNDSGFGKMMEKKDLKHRDSYHGPTWGNKEGGGFWPLKGPVEDRGQQPIQQKPSIKEEPALLTLPWCAPGNASSDETPDYRGMNDLGGGSPLDRDSGFGKKRDADGFGGRNSGYVAAGARNAEGGRDNGGYSPRLHVPSRDPSSQQPSERSPEQFIGNRPYSGGGSSGEHTRPSYNDPHSKGGNPLLNDSGFGLKYDRYGDLNPSSVGYHSPGSANNEGGRPNMGYVSRPIHEEYTAGRSSPQPSGNFQSSEIPSRPYSEQESSRHPDYNDVDAKGGVPLGRDSGFQPAYQRFVDTNPVNPQYSRPNPANAEGGRENDGYSPRAREQRDQWLAQQGQGRGEQPASFNDIKFGNKKSDDIPQRYDGVNDVGGVPFQGDDGYGGYNRYGDQDIPQGIYAVGDARNAEGGRDDDGYAKKRRDQDSAQYGEPNDKSHYDSRPYSAPQSSIHPEYDDVNAKGGVPLGRDSGFQPAYQRFAETNPVNPRYSRPNPANAEGGRENDGYSPRARAQRDQWLAQQGEGRGDPHTRLDDIKFGNNDDLHQRYDGVNDVGGVPFQGDDGYGGYNRYGDQDIPHGIYAVGDARNAEGGRDNDGYEKKRRDQDSAQYGEPNADRTQQSHYDSRPVSAPQSSVYREYDDVNAKGGVPLGRDSGFQTVYQRFAEMNPLNPTYSGPNAANAEGGKENNGYSPRAREQRDAWLAAQGEGRGDPHAKLNDIHGTGNNYGNEMPSRHDGVNERGGIPFQGDDGQYGGYDRYGDQNIPDGIYSVGDARNAEGGRDDDGYAKKRRDQDSAQYGESGHPSQSGHPSHHGYNPSAAHSAYPDYDGVNDLGGLPLQRDSGFGKAFERYGDKHQQGGYAGPGAANMEGGRENNGYSPRHMPPSRSGSPQPSVHVTAPGGDYTSVPYSMREGSTQAPSMMSQIYSYFGVDDVGGSPLENDDGFAPRRSALAVHKNDPRYNVTYERPTSANAEGGRDNGGYTQRERAHLPQPTPAANPPLASPGPTPSTTQRDPMYPSTYDHYSDGHRSYNHVNDIGGAPLENDEGFGKAIGNAFYDAFGFGGGDKKPTYVGPSDRNREGGVENGGYSPRRPLYPEVDRGQRSAPDSREPSVPPSVPAQSHKQSERLFHFPSSRSESYQNYDGPDDVGGAALARDSGFGKGIEKYRQQEALNDLYAPPGSLYAPPGNNNVEGGRMNGGYFDFLGAFGSSKQESEPVESSRVPSQGPVEYSTAQQRNEAYHPESYPDYTGINDIGGASPLAHDPGYGLERDGVFGFGDKDGPRQRTTYAEATGANKEGGRHNDGYADVPGRYHDSEGGEGAAPLGAEKSDAHVRPFGPPPGEGGQISAAGHQINFPQQRNNLFGDPNQKKGEGFRPHTAGIYGTEIEQLQREREQFIAGQEEDRFNLPKRDEAQPINLNHSGNVFNKEKSDDVYGDKAYNQNPDQPFGAYPIQTNRGVDSHQSHYPGKDSQHSYNYDGVNDIGGVPYGNDYQRDRHDPTVDNRYATPGEANREGGRHNEGYSPKHRDDSEIQVRTRFDSDIPEDQAHKYGQSPQEDGIKYSTMDPKRYNTMYSDADAIGGAPLGRDSGFQKSQLIGSNVLSNKEDLLYAPPSGVNKEGHQDQPVVTPDFEKRVESRREGGLDGPYSSFMERIKEEEANGQWFGGMLASNAQKKATHRPNIKRGSEASTEFSGLQGSLINTASSGDGGCCCGGADTAWDALVGLFTGTTVKRPVVNPNGTRRESSCKVCEEIRNSGASSAPPQNLKSPFDPRIKTEDKAYTYENYAEKYPANNPNAPTQNNRDFGAGYKYPMANRDSSGFYEPAAKRGLNNSFGSIPNVHDQRFGVGENKVDFTVNQGGMSPERKDPRARDSAYSLEPINKDNKKNLMRAWTNKLREDGFSEISESELSEMEAQLDRMKVHNDIPFAEDNPYWRKILGVLGRDKVVDTFAYGNIEVFVMDRDDQNQERLSIYEEGKYFNENDMKLIELAKQEKEKKKEEKNPTFKQQDSSDDPRLLQSISKLFDV